MTIQNQSPIHKEHFWLLRVIVGRFQPLHPVGQTASQNREFFTSELRIEATKCPDEKNIFFCRNFGSQTFQKIKNYPNPFTEL